MGNNVEIQGINSTDSTKRISPKIDPATGRLLVDSNLTTGDIQIGAVEIKNATTDDRATVDTSGNLKVDLGTLISGEDQTNDLLKVGGNVANDAADVGNPIKVGGKAIQANPTAVAALDRVDGMFDDVGRQVIRTNAVRDLVVDNNITLTTTTETTLLAAGAAGVFHDLVELVIGNSSATLEVVKIRDDTAGTVLMSIPVAASGGGAIITLPVPKNQTTAAKNWTAQLTTGVTSIEIYAQAVKNV